MPMGRCSTSTVPHRTSYEQLARCRVHNGACSELCGGGAQSMQCIEWIRKLKIRHTNDESNSFWRNLFNGAPFERERARLPVRECYTWSAEKSNCAEETWPRSVHVKWNGLYDANGSDFWVSHGTESVTLWRRLNAMRAHQFSTWHSHVINSV